MKSSDLCFDPAQQTLADLFEARLKKSPDDIAVQYFSGNAYLEESWQQLGAKADCMASRFKTAGLREGDRVGIFMETGYAWSMSDLLCIRNNWISVACHPGWSAMQLAHALALSRPLVVLAGSGQRALLKAALKLAGFPCPLIDFEAFLDNVGSHAQEDSSLLACLTDHIHACGRTTLPDGPDHKKNEPSAIVFTSGTNGLPKGVLLSHKAMLAAAWHAYHTLGFDGRKTATFHWLPFAHMFGRTGIYLDWIAGSTAHYTRGISRFADDLALYQPGVLFAVPQIMTRVRRQIENAVSASPIFVRCAFRCAQMAGRLCHFLFARHGCRWQPAVRQLLFRRIHSQLGGKLALIVVGSAPVSAQDRHFFETTGIAVREGYGMTETAGVTSVQPFDHPGSGAGQLIGSIQARLSDCDELWLRGPSLMSRYLGEEARGANDWLKSGDQASLSLTGDLTVTGRLNDMIIGASGENISPQPIEDRLADHALIEDACLAGTGRPSIVALLTLSCAGQSRHRESGSTAFLQLITQHVRTVNAALPRHERVLAYALLAGPFSTAHETLTLTGKKRRKNIHLLYQHMIDDLYLRLQEHRDMQSCDPVCMTKTGSAPPYIYFCEQHPMSTNTPLPLIDISGLQHAYLSGDNSPAQVLKNIDFTVARGEFVAILGQSGSGKSTLFNMIGGLDQPDAGMISVNGHKVSNLSPKQRDHFLQNEVAFIFQFFNLLPALTAFENVMIALEAMPGIKKDAAARVHTLLEQAGLQGKMHRFPAQLSGGEQQRVAIVRALVKDAPLVLADEPTGNLDEETAASIMDLIISAQKNSGATLLLITHDMSIARRADRIVQITRGHLQPLQQAKADSVMKEGRHSATPAA